jgi:hypothetical protein
MFVFLTAAASFGAVLLEDNFTDAAFSRGKWLDSDGLTVAVNGGSCNLNNTTGVGNYLHTFSSPKPSTFTITYTLKSKTGTAGALFCKQSGAYDGYFLTIENDMLVLYNMKQTAVEGGYNIGWEPIGWKESFDINPSNNEITVSKSGSRIVLFANGAYVGEFTDNKYSSGDFALFLSGNTSAVFGPVRITDVFTDGGPRTSFSDDFNNGRSKYWRYLKNGEPEISDMSGALTINTGADVYSWMYVDLGLTDFEARVDVSHVSGGTTINNIYGIVLFGAPPAGSNEPRMVYFGITGGRKYSVWSGSPRPDPEQSTAIRGSSGDLGAVYIDTLEVKKASGSSKYEFIVNGQTLADYPVVDFPIIRIGIFAYPEITIRFDNFEAANEGSASIKFGRSPQQTIRSGKVIRNADNVFYDLRGRKRYAANPQATGRASIRAAGVYVNKSGREVLTDRNKRTRSK